MNHYLQFILSLVGRLYEHYESYQFQQIQIREILTHGEYDKDKWKL
jgi:mRNA-degrading endonuclease HigB of HigAB toxin-antitoxin module